VRLALLAVRRAWKILSEQAFRSASCIENSAYQRAVVSRLAKLLREFLEET
jgi:hypothetical protein